MGQRRTLLVGLDAACWEYLDPLVAAGKMPVLEQLMRRGAYGTLQSTMPPWTPTAWSSIVTGKNPGKHGVYDLLWRRPASYEFVPTSGKVRAGSPFWSYLNAAGLRVGLVNVPYTHPPEPLEGFVVAGFGAGKSAERLTYPHDELARIEAAFGAYRPSVEVAILRKGTPEEILQAEREHQTLQAQIACDLAERHSVDVLAINLMLLDHANHKMPVMDLVDQALESCDRDLDRLLQSFNPDDVMLISDHGSRRLRGRFLLHAWLRDRGYQVQVPRTTAEQSQALNWLLVRLNQSENGASPGADRVRRALLRYGVPRLPKGLARGFWRDLERSIPFARDYVETTDAVDYARTRVFPGSIYSGLLYLNLDGRDPSGFIPAGERLAVLEELRAALAQVPDPETDEPLFANMYASEEIYRGPALARAPDLILDSYHKDWNIQTGRFTPAPEPSDGSYFVGNQREHGWHSREGVCVFAGPDFASAGSSLQGHVMDIPATLLALRGVPVPEDYDGRVLQEAFSLDFLERKPPESQPGDAGLDGSGSAAYTDDEAAEIEGHLRALGYIE